MTSRSERLADTLERVQQRRIEAELLWLRRARIDRDWLDSARGLLTEESADEFQSARREHAWTEAEERAFVEQRAELAFAVELADGAHLLAELTVEPVALPFGREGLGELLQKLMRDGDHEGRLHRARGLTDAPSVLAPRLIELRARALAVREEQLALGRDREAERAKELDLALGFAGAPPPTAAAPATPSGVVLADTPPAAPIDPIEQFLASTDDATREMTRWLVKPFAITGTIPWHVLLRALRAPELDGLAKPARRLARIANGLRGLEFERDLDARVRGEVALAALDPRTRVLALSVPGDIRIAQAKLEFGVLSDVYAAHGVGRGLALALVSPALPQLVRRPTAPGIADVLGTMFMQLRADPEYLHRVENQEELWVEKLARHCAIINLLEARVQAALASVAGPIRRQAEWSQQLTAALERALGAEVPTTLAILTAWSAQPGTAAFEACAAGLAAHVGLRDRLDSDWYRNPRASEVLRGAATRGSTLAIADFLEELGVSATAASARSIELLG